MLLNVMKINISTKFLNFAKFMKQKQKDRAPVRLTNSGYLKIHEF